MSADHPLYAVYGASGCGRGLLPVVRAELAARAEPASLVFVDDAAHGQTINGHVVLSYDALLASSSRPRYVNVAIANAAVRRQLFERCLADGLLPFTIRASNVVVMDDVEVGPGAALSPFVTLTSNIRIGVAFQANLYAYVEHDCVIGDYVTFGPGVHCNGNVVIEDDAYVGAGAVIRHGRPGAPVVIGRGAVVGMGAVVTRSVEPGAVVVGNPARPLAPSTRIGKYA